METIDISTLDKAEVLSALYNASRQQGMGFLHSRGAAGMTKEQAQEEIDALRADNRPLDFDYLHGRVMKVDITGDAFRPWCFDRNNGDGAAALAIDAIRRVTTKAPKTAIA